MTMYNGINLNQLLAGRPDVAQEYSQESTRDSKSINNLQKMGIYSDTDYAKWWLDNYGIPAGYTQQTAAPNTPVTPATPATPAPDPNAIGPGTGLGAGLSTAVPNNKQSALAQAQAKAKLSIQGRGLNYDDYSGDINGYLNDILGTIPDTDTNPGSYFDPNFADQILNGKEATQRRAYQSAVTSGLGKNPINHSSLDATIQKILDEQVGSAQKTIDAGLKRGQFNEVGVNAGMSKLESAKAKAKAKLDLTADDVLSGYDSKFNDIYSSALQAASGFKLGDTFDPTPFNDQYARLSQQATQDAEGQLYDSIGDQPLINLSDIRGAIGQGQGAVNLTDLDVLDATAKRKQASGVGRGLGSQGSF